MGLLETALERFSSRLQGKADQISISPSEWIEKNYYVPDPRDPITGERLPPGPLLLAPHQKRIIDEALARKEDGTLKYSTVIYSAPKKSGKSAIASAVTLYFAHHNPDAHLYCLANDGKQSADRIYEPIYKNFRLHRQHGGIFSDVSPNKTEVTLPNNTKIEAVPCDAAGEAGAQPLFICYCFDQETEILTKSGWKTYSQISIEDDFATLSDDGMFEWQKPVQINAQQYSGSMWLGETENISVMVTPNHRMYGKFFNTNMEQYRGDWGKNSIEETVKCGFYGVRMACDGWIGEDQDFFILPATKRRPEKAIPMQLWAEFLGWYLSEGCVYKKKNRTCPEAVMIGQSKTANPDKWQRIWDMLLEMGLTPHEWKNNNSIVVYDIRLAHYCYQFGKSNDKFIPTEIKNLSSEYLAIFLDAYRKGDGWDIPKAFAIGTTSRRMADDLQEVGQKLGYYMTVYEYPDARSKFLQYKIQFWSGKNGNKLRLIERDRWKQVDYTGVVYCPTVPNGVVYVRRKGKCHWQGQSELWGFDTEGKKRLFSEMTIPPTLYGQAMRWIESYAGFTGVSELLEGLYQTAVINGSPHPKFKDLRSSLSDNGDYVVFTNETAGMFAYWDHEPRMLWQSQDYYCLPLPEKKDDLRVLTQTGWKCASDITLEDSLCTRNPAGVMEYQKPVNIFCEEYSGTLLHYKTRKVDMYMTPEHRVLAAYATHTRKVKGILSQPFVYEYKTAREAKKHQLGWIPGQATWDHAPLEIYQVENETYNATDFVELLAWYLSEGNTPADKRNRKVYYSMVCIGQDLKANPDKHAQIVKLCERMGLRFSANANGILIFNSRLARYFHQFGLSHDKYIPRFVLEDCSKEQIKIFLSAYLAGDGSPAPNGNAWMVYTNSDQMRFDLMEAGFKAGYRPKYRGAWSSAPEKGRLPIHHISFQLSHLGWSSRKHWEEVDAPAGTKVWCPTLPNGNFYVMVNGTCLWTGNSQEAAVLSAPEFARIHRNQWVSPIDAFIQPTMWEAVKKDLSPLIDKHTPVVLGVDGAISNDYAAIVGVTRDPDDDQHVAVRFCYIFTPTKSGGNIKISETVEPKIRELCEKYHVVCVAYDAYQLQDMAQRLRKDGVAWMYQFSQGADRAIADKALYDRVLNKTLWWDDNGDGLPSLGTNVPSLYQHVTQAGAKVTAGKLRLEKLSDNTKIDAAVALSMAAYQCMQLNISNSEKDEHELVKRLSRGQISDQEFLQLIKNRTLNG